MTEATNKPKWHPFTGERWHLVILVRSMMGAQGMETRYGYRLSDFAVTPPKIYEVPPRLGSARLAERNSKYVIERVEKIERSEKNGQAAE